MHGRGTKKVDSSLCKDIGRNILRKERLMIEKNKNIFEELKEVIGCEFISDLKYPPFSSKAKLLLKVWELDTYSLFSLNDITSYLYKTKPFETKGAVIAFLKE